MSKVEIQAQLDAAEGDLKELEVFKHNIADANVDRHEARRIADKTGKDKHKQAVVDADNLWNDHRSKLETFKQHSIHQEHGGYDRHIDVRAQKVLDLREQLEKETA